MSILVANQSTSTCKVSINQWGDSGDTGNFTIDPSSNGSWGRSDPRGFLMVLEGGTQPGTYFVEAGTEVAVRDDEVTGALKIN